MAILAKGDDVRNGTKVEGTLSWLRAERGQWVN